MRHIYGGYPLTIRVHHVGTKQHDNQSATSIGTSIPSFGTSLPRNSYTGSLNSAAGQSSIDVKANEMRRESMLAGKAAEKRPRKARPAKKKGEDGVGSSVPSMGGAWSDVMKADGIDQSGAGEDPVGGEGDSKSKAKRKYVRPPKQKADTGNMPLDNQGEGEGRDVPPGHESSGMAGDGKGMTEGEDDVAAGKRKREGNGRGSRGGKAPAVGRSQKPASSPNAAKRLKPGSPTLDGSAYGEGGTAAREEVSGAVAYRA